MRDIIAILDPRLVAGSMSPRRHVSQFPTPAQHHIERLLAKAAQAKRLAAESLGAYGTDVRIEMALEIERGVRRCSR